MEATQPCLRTTRATAFAAAERRVQVGIRRGEGKEIQVDGIPEGAKRRRVFAVHVRPSLKAADHLDEIHEAVSRAQQLAAPEDANPGQALAVAFPVEILR